MIMRSMIRHVCKGLHGEDMRAELQRDEEHREYTHFGLTNEDDGGCLVERQMRGEEQNSNNTL